jgi:transcriptional regulator with XRE-family HTH domain
MTAPNRLRELRENAHLTRDEVATHINSVETKTGAGGVTDNTIYRWERGKNTPGIPRQRILADLFGVTVDDLGIHADQANQANQPEPDPLAFLDEETAIPAEDPRVTHSREQWVRTRQALNIHRRSLTALAAGTYPEAARLGDTGLISGPGWIPDVPVRLDAIHLTHDPQAPAPRLDGTEPESAHVRPLCTITKPYGRYTAAIRDLAKPKLFENRSAWRMTELGWSDGAGKMTFADTYYFASVDVNEVVSHEIATVALDADGNPQPTAPRLRDLPYRRLIGDPFDLAARPVMPAISTLTIRAGGQPTFLLHRRDPRSVAMAGGMLQVIPSGIFQASSVLPAAAVADFSLLRNIEREFAEELLGFDEHDGDGQPVNYGVAPFAEMNAAVTDGRMRIHCLGVALDALTLVGEILTVAVLEADLFDRMAVDFVDSNDEGSIVKGRLPFTEATIGRILGSGRMAPAGAGCLLLAWEHRDLLLAG